MVMIGIIDVVVSFSYRHKQMRRNALAKKLLSPSYSRYPYILCRSTTRRLQEKWRPKNVSG